MERLEGLTAVVTGAGRGIGRATAAALHAAGAHVTALGRDADRLAETVAAGDADAFVVADMTDHAAVSAAFAHAGQIDILINNAGAATSAPFARTEPDAFRTMVEINLLSAVHGAHAALPGMLTRGFGRIVNVASTAGLKGYAYASAYAAAKHALIGLTRSLALETARKGVTVNAVCPGFTDTDLLAASVARIAETSGRSETDARAELTKNNPQGRLVTPAEAAAAIVSLCGRNAGAVNGAAIVVDGGETA